MTGSTAPLRLYLPGLKLEVAASIYCTNPGFDPVTRKLSAHGVSFEQIAAALVDANLRIPPGKYRDGFGELAILVDDLFRTREQVVSTVILRDLDGSFVTL